MAAEQLVTFEDIYTAICEELKYQLTDGTSVARIKRDINMIYLSEVMDYKNRAWWWARQDTNISTFAKFDTGTVSLTGDSTTVTFSDAPTISLAGYYIKVTGLAHVIKISSHTASTTTATLEKAWVDDDVTGVGFKCWKDYAALPSTMKDVIQVLHDKKKFPLSAENSSAFEEKRNPYPDYEGYPQIYNTGDFDADGNRIITWYPACSDTRVILRVEGRQEAPKLNADDDEPLMPIEDRIVLFYGACSRAWARERNESEANKNWNLFLQKRNQMVGKSGGAPQTTEMVVNADYLRNKRYRRLVKRGYTGRWESSD